MAVTNKEYYTKLEALEPSSLERAQEIVTTFFPDGDIALRSSITGLGPYKAGISVCVNDTPYWLGNDMYLMRHTKKLHTIKYAFFATIDSLLRTAEAIHLGGTVEGIPNDVHIDWDRVPELLWAAHWAFNAYPEQQIGHELWPDKFQKPHPWDWKRPEHRLRKFVDSGLLTRSAFDKYADRNPL